MKKFIITLVLLYAAFLGFVFLFDPACFYGAQISSGNLNYYPHEIFNTCMVTHGEWNGARESMVLVIPDEISGKKVKIWGDHYPGPFQINMEGILWCCGEELVPEDAVIVPRYLTIYMGKNLTQLRDFHMKVYYAVEQDPVVYYQILVEIQCAEDNPLFYSADGKLYRKADNLLIDVFFYASDYHETEKDVLK